MTQLEDLNDYCLLEVLDKLLPDQLLKMQQVNRRLSRLASDKLQFKTKAITFNKINSRFTDCAHLDTISRDQLLVLEPQLTNTNDLLKMLATCNGVKSIDFDSCKLTLEFLIEVFCCNPNIECIKFIPELVENVDCDNVFDEIGHKLVHIVIRRLHGSLPKYSWSNRSRVLAAVAAGNCPNIRQFDWLIGLQGRDLAAFKMLSFNNPNCRVKIRCEDSAEYLVENNLIDELDVHSLKWSKLEGLQLNRLSNLTMRIFNSNEVNRNHQFVYRDGIEFAGLKRLDIRQMINKYVKLLPDCRFPQLEEFCFNASAGIEQDNYEDLFQRMTSVRKLTTSCDDSLLIPCLPLLSSIGQLNNLETIYLKIWRVRKEWESKEFIEQLEEYVDELQSLEMLTVDTRLCYFDELDLVRDGINRLKMKQNRVKVNLIPKK